LTRFGLSADLVAAAGWTSPEAPASDVPAPDLEGRFSMDVTRRLRRASSALVVAAIAAIAFPMGALAATWGPRYSSYDGTRRVMAEGVLTRYANRSYSKVRVCDQRNEGWPVYGWTSWSQVIDGAGTQSGAGTSMTTGETATCASKERNVSWTSFFGFWVRSGGCAQVGWPVPDNCVAPTSEWHRP